MAEATMYKDASTVTLTAWAAMSPGEVFQLPDGRAGYVLGLQAIAPGDLVEFQVDGQVTVAKTASIVILPGGEVMWDVSANSATIPVLTASEDFLLGVCQDGAASAATSMVVDLNKRAKGLIDLHESAFDHARVYTAGIVAAGMQGGSYTASFSPNAEAQKLDLLSVQTFPVTSDWVLEAIVTVVTDCDTDVGDLNVGVANATHASDADQITESCFFHFDMGADNNLDAESDDGTTEVNATDTTKDWADGTPVHLQIDGRTTTDIQMYVNGVNVLPATVFKLDKATGPLKALFHLEKSSNDTAGVVRLDKLQVRIVKPT